MSSKPENSVTRSDIIAEPVEETAPEEGTETADVDAADGDVAAAEATDEVVADEAQENTAEAADAQKEFIEAAKAGFDYSIGEDRVCSSEICLNCGTELMGKYCHKCGQHITRDRMTVKGLIMSYLDNAYFWDSHHLKTLWLLISRPGHLTNEYISGKFVSQVHPLKLNMFLLLLFLTLFVFFGSDQRINNRMDEITRSEMMFAALQMDDLSNNETYAEKIKASPRDTVKLLAPLMIAEKYPTVVSAQKVIQDSKGQSVDLFVAEVPRVFIDEGVIKPDDDGFYRFNTEYGYATEELDVFRLVWEQMTTFAQQYFSLIILFTTPILAFSLRAVHRTRKRSYFTHFIFSMHYLAFVGAVINAIYLCYLVLHPSMTLLIMIFTLFSSIYFARAFRAVYQTSWFRSITKACVSSAIYYVICLSIFMLIFVAVCCVVAYNLPDDVMAGYGY